ncbi:MAG: glyoxalase [Bacteroidia bacterium]
MIEKSRRDQRISGMREMVVFNAELAKCEERFQGEVLRPVLKLQNDLILVLVKNYLKRKGEKFQLLPENDWREQVSEALKNDQPFRTQLTGLVIGLFTVSEMEEFLENQETYKRRLQSLLIERVVSQRAKIED